MNKNYKNRIFSYMAVGLMTFSSVNTLSAQESSVEVLHFWTSGGEAKAMRVLRDAFEQRGGKWEDVGVAGGGGDAAQQVLRARVLSGNSPGVVQMKAPEVQEWHEEGVLADITDVATKGDWKNLLPESFSDFVKCGDKYCAVPVNIHRVDNLYANKSVLEKHGISIPQTWEEFNSSAKNYKQPALFL